MLRTNNRSEKRRSRINILSDAYHEELHNNIHLIDLGLTLKVLVIKGKPVHTWMLSRHS